MSKTVKIRIQASTDFDFDFKFPQIKGTNEYSIKKSDDTTIITMQYPFEVNSTEHLKEFIRGIKIKNPKKNDSKEMWQLLSKEYLSELDKWHMTCPHSTDHQLMSGNWGFNIDVDVISKEFISHPKKLKH